MSDTAPPRPNVKTSLLRSWPPRAKGSRSKQKSCHFIWLRFCFKDPPPKWCSFWFHFKTKPNRYPPPKKRTHPYCPWNRTPVDSRTTVDVEPGKSHVFCRRLVRFGADLRCFKTPSRISGSASSIRSKDFPWVVFLAGRHSFLFFFVGQLNTLADFLTERDKPIFLKPFGWL